MNIKIWLLTSTLISVSSITQVAGNAKTCSPAKNVSLKIGHEGIIECICDDSVSLYWYFGNDTAAVKPFIYIDNSVKYGPGYLSGEYDINANGSLVIKDVSSTHGGAYAVLIIEPGNLEPRVEMFTVYVNGPKETDVIMKSNCDKERKSDNAEKVTTIPTEEPGKIFTSPVKNNEMAHLKSFQAEIDQLKRIDHATLALVVIVLFGISLVIWRSYTGKSKKNPNCEDEEAQCHQQLKRLVVSCNGSCPHGNSHKSTDS